MADDDEPELCVYEWPAGKPLPPNARDCSDEFLPQAERVTDAERAALANSTFRPDGSRVSDAEPDRGEGRHKVRALTLGSAD